jgi:hypothetical protein
MFARLTISEMAALLPLLLVQIMCTHFLKNLLGRGCGGKTKNWRCFFWYRMAVGVKECTVYLLKARSGEYEWEIEQRYCEFYALYRQLKDFFYEWGLSLPPTWEIVEKESSN